MEKENKSLTISSPLDYILAFEMGSAYLFDYIDIDNFIKATGTEH